LLGCRVNEFWGKSARIYGQSITLRGHNTELQPPVDSHGIDKRKIRNEIIHVMSAGDQGISGMSVGERSVPSLDLESSKLDVLITIRGNDVGGWGVERPLTIHTE